MNLILQYNKYFFDSISNNNFLQKKKWILFFSILNNNYITSEFNFSKTKKDEYKNLIVIFLTLVKKRFTHCAVPVWLTGRYDTPLVISYFLPTLLPRVLRIWERVFYFQAFFTLHSFLLVSRLPWGRQFNLKASRVSRWSSKHSPGPTICWNHSNPQKFYMSRLYLRGRAALPWNINLYWELALWNVSFEMFASHEIWTLFTDRQTC